MKVSSTMRKVTLTNKIAKVIKGASKGSKIIARLIQGMRFLANNPVTRRLGAASVLLNLGTLYNMSQAQSAYDSGKISPKQYKSAMVAGYGELAQALGTSGLGMLTGFFVGGPVGALAGMGVGLLADIGLSVFTNSGEVMGDKLFNFFDRQPEINYSDATAKEERDALANEYAETKNGFGAVSGFDVDKYLELTRIRESSNNYKADNHIGFIGAYQMGSALLEDAGMLKPGMTEKYGDKGSAAAVYHPDAWADGSSLDSFLNNPQLQDLVAMNFTKFNYDSLTQNGVIKADMAPAQIAGALAAAHHGGIGGATKFYLEGTDTKDFALNTSIGGTVNKMVSDYSGIPAGSSVSAISSMAALESTGTIDRYSSYVLKMLGEHATSVATPPEEKQTSAEPPLELTQAQAQSQAALVAITTMQNQLNVVSTEVIKLRQTVSQQQDFPHSENPDLDNYA